MTEHADSAAIKPSTLTKDVENQAEDDLERKPTAKTATKSVPESGGPKGPEPTRYGDWERNGRCVDF